MCVGLTEMNLRLLHNVAPDMHWQQLKQYLQPASCASTTLIMLVTLPAMLGTATATNTNSTHTHKCQERAEPTPKMVFEALSVLSVRLATTNSRPYKLN